jgi:dephospho-CoA kinase
MLIVGLTGGVASGKTVVSKIFQDEGAYLINADQIARELVKPQTPAWKALRRVFGEEIVEKNGMLHRKKLAAKVFSNTDQRDLLNRILHPRIKKEVKRRLKVIGQKDPEAIVVIDAALLVETGGYREMDKLIVVTATEIQQIERLRERDGVSREEARKIISSQMALVEKLKVADFIIRNEGSLEEMRGLAKKVFQELKRIVLQKREGLELQESS